jgi:DNA-binding IclR family transcriptional regulator
VAAVSITVPAQHVANEQADHLIQLVRDAAGKLTQRINHH